MFKTAKQLLAISISTGFLSLPVISHAADLIITNKTPGYTSSRINGGFCSYPILGEIGRTPPDGKAHAIPSDIVNQACSTGDPNNCTAEVYEASDCNGPQIAKVVISTTRGVVSAVATGPYPINAPLGSFNISMG